MSKTIRRARVLLDNLDGRLSAAQLHDTKGGHVYRGVLPVVVCPKRLPHFGFFNVRRLFGNLCVRRPLKFGVHDV